MIKMPEKCYFSWEDPKGSWDRILRSIKDNNKTWVCEDEGNSNSDIKLVFCLSACDHDRPNKCDTNGKILLSVIRNLSRKWVGVAVEIETHPDTLISADNKTYIKRIRPAIGRLAKNADAYSVKDVELDIPVTLNKTNIDVKIGVLRDGHYEHLLIAELEKEENWSLKNINNITYSMIEGYI